MKKSLDEFNAEQALRDRVDKLNASIDGINQRSHNVNDPRVEPHKQSVAQWREQCGNRRYREEDEIVIKKELATASNGDSAATVRVSIHSS